MMSRRRASWVLFDMNGTLLDPAGIAEPLGGRDQDRQLVADAFQEALLLTMADTVSGGAWRPLTEYLRATLERGLRTRGRDLGPLDAALQRAGAMDAFPEAGGALALLREAGLRTGILTNSTTDAAERAVQTAGLSGHLEVVIGSDSVQTFKPHPRVYEHAAARLGADTSQLCLVAAHAWDVMGAMRAGLHGAWVARGEGWLVPIVPQPDVRGEDLEDVASQLAARAQDVTR